MRRALRLAHRGVGTTSPNPAVGAVVVRDGEIVGEGYHHRAGGPHAEVLALASARERARGATLYVTLEPCNHQGRTPPCTDAILRAGVAAVHVAIRDPNPTVAGGGIERLRAAGIHVVVGDQGAKAFRQNRAFFSWALAGRPLVILKSAHSLDGKVATADGASKYLTGRAALARAHTLRRTADAILVGVGTVLADDPELTYRGRRPGQNPLRVILDSRGRTPLAARVLAPNSPPTLVVTGRAPDPAWTAAISARGHAVVAVDADCGGRPDLHAVLAHLADRGVRTVLVEGGPTVHGSFIREALADIWVSFVAPRLLGGPALSSVAGPPLGDLASAPRLTIRKVRRLGADAWIAADFETSPTASVPHRLLAWTDGSRPLGGEKARGQDW